MTRFPIRFDRWFRIFSSALFLRPANSYIAVDDRRHGDPDDDVTVRMGWSFLARFPRSAIAATSRLEARPLSRGVHGFGGRWLVNGAGDRILAIDLAPAQRARVLGVRVRLDQLLVSVDDPDQLAAALRAS